MAKGQRSHKRKSYQRNLLIFGVSAVVLELTLLILLEVVDPAFSGRDRIAIYITFTITCALLTLAFVWPKVFLTEDGFNIETQRVLQFSRRHFIPFDKIESLTGSWSDGIEIVTHSGESFLIKTTEMSMGDKKRLHEDAKSILGEKVLIKPPQK